jgi:endoglucanase
MKFAARSCWGLLSVAFVFGASSCVKRGSAPEDAGSSGNGGPSASNSQLSPQNNLLQSSSFDDGKSVPWTTSFTAPADGAAGVENGALCVEVKNVGANPWDAQFRHREMVIQKGHAYTLSFKAYASAPTKARPKIGMSGPPYAEYWSETIELGVEPREFRGKFTMWEADDATAELAFHIGGSLAKAGAPFKVCIDDIRLDDPEFVAKARATSSAAPNLAVNQVGYLPHASKVATLRSSAASPLEWQLLDARGSVVQAGKTTPFGVDAASGDGVHLVDFSTVTKTGKNFRLRVGVDQSYPFSIESDVYGPLKYDALAYFYHNRSGVEIKLPYAGKPELARPAGHLSDQSVKCAPGSGCDYSLDVSGGWYDAGDHGKYVVNAGISVWTLLNQYERGKFLGTSSGDFGDGKLRIPEAGNGVPDLLDEARYELEFELKMQVPEGKPLAGMVHHKMHDASWTGLGTAPHEDKQVRYLFPPSTAATLNLAANAAQAARIWKGIDAAFSERCLKAAERAWAAAKAHPNVIAPENVDGGGAYGDQVLSDEFYWAAAELDVTTGKAEYRDFVAASPLDPRFPTQAGGHKSSFNWGTTDALGMISLAIVPSAVEKARVDALRKRIVAAADEYALVQSKEGYRTALERTPEGKYVWGSNSFVLNNLIVLALAHDFTGEQRYLDAVVSGMNYLLGNNPLGQSYVTGYGERPLENPHHRFWAHQANAKYPSPPSGVVSGGPNSNVDDPYSKSAGLKGCPAAKCFVDHIEAYSVNEVTINWNAPLAWVAAYLDEEGKAK